MIKNKDHRISFFALGGLGEIGANCYVYRLFNNEGDEEFYIVDLGMGFNDIGISSVDTFFPDISFLKENKDKIKAILVTHGHEDHIGGISYLWQDLGCPIYATSWTADLLKEKLKEFNLEKKAKIHIVNKDKEYKIGSLSFTWIEVTHSIIDSSLLFIKTPLGNIIHSGDFKIDMAEDNIVKKLKQQSNNQIDYLFCDSTNVLDEGKTQAESTTKKDLYSLIESTNGAVWATFFASNLYRVQTLADIATKLNKKLVPFGRSMELHKNLAIKHGYLNENVFITEDEIKHYDRNKLIFLVSGGQGEYRSVLFNVLVENRFRQKIQNQDTVIFSSRIIPGNESKVMRLYNILATKDIDFFTVADHNIHVSGHPKIEDLKIMYDFIKPKWIIPIHGEAMHLKAHSSLAKNLGYKTFMCLNGEEVELFTEIPEEIGSIDIGRLTYEGNRILNFEDEIFKNRKKIFYEGAVFLTILFKNKEYKIVDITVIGLLTEQEQEILNKQIIAKANSYLSVVAKNNKMSDGDIKEQARIFVRKYFKEKLDKKPIVKLHCVR
jgi:ribonuclease J